jgi:glycosyltransferase involved in cell wall biosynthesis
LTSSVPTADTRAIAVAIPCFNEAAAIGDLVARWRVVFPEAEVVVFDNNSRDATALLAEAAGARVVPVPRQGKGYAVRAIFAELADRPALVMTDGDATYPPEDVGRLLAPVLAGEADMVVGARRPVSVGGVSGMAPVRGLGNALIRAAFRALIGRGPGDLLSGYRVFGPRFLAEVKPRSTGFEIETELTGEAVSRQMRVVEVEVPYHPRIAGSVSKLRAGRDGLRILFMIMRIAARLQPLRLVAVLLAAAACLGAAICVARAIGAGVTGFAQ